MVNDYHCMKRLILSLLILLSTSVIAQTADQYLQFLFHHMPLPDSVDYSRQYWQRQVDCAMKARRTMPWGSSIPEETWRRFVLPVRVNNESLDDARSVIFKELHRRVMGMTMEEAALEVNHWCHEHVSYQPSDARTSAPLSTMRNTIGRCGEESTFTVAALRAVGIPARQVYCPRWAHTDDNHAWVEVWTNGKWHFMGACEPEAEQDKGWFNWAASRAMMVHTRVFGGDYQGQEEVLSRNACYTEINCLATYAPTRQVTVKVTDNNGTPIVGARVDFRIYNYAEFYPIASLSTDKNGCATITTGYGDLLAWVSKDGHRYAVEYIDAKTNNITVNEFTHVGMEWNEDLDIHAPTSKLEEPDRSIVDTTSPNAHRLMHEDSLRTAYQQLTFWNETKARDYLAKQKIDSSEWQLLTKARSNVETIATFLRKAKDKTKAVELLHTLTDKDLRDVSLDVLWDSYRSNIGRGPRVSTEPLRPYMQFLAKHLPKMKATEWVAWVKANIKIDNQSNPQQLPMSAVGVYQHRTADSRSRDLFCVSGARALGIPAWLDDATGQVFVDGQAIEFDEDKKESPDATLQIDVPDSILYYHRYSISRLVGGRPVSLEYPDDDPTVTLQLKRGIRLPHGTYLLTTGTRLATGNVLSHMQMFLLEPGETLKVPVILRQTDEAKAGTLKLQDSDKQASSTSFQTTK